MNATAPTKCWTHRIDSSNEPLKVSDEKVIVTNTELCSCSECLAIKNQQLEDKVRELEAAILARTNFTTPELTEKLRMLSLALATIETRDRRALAQDLHDDLGQLLAVIGLKMTAIEKLKLPKSTNAALKECSAVIDQASRKLRAMAFDLNPPMLDDPLGFGAAMAWLAHELHEMHQLEVTIEDAGDPMPMDPILGITLFRAVREVLVNITKHAGVKKVALVQSCRGGNLMVVTVTVIGSGFDHESVVSVDASSGFGFLNMRERLGLIGGAVSIQSKPGHDTTVTLEVPLLTDYAGRAMVEPS